MRPAEPPSEEQWTVSPSSPAGAPATSTRPAQQVAEEAARLKFAVEALPQPDRWLFVQQAKPGALGAWARGGFDVARNRVNIHTHEVERFAVDAALIPIDWDKLVIVRIDGTSSELRKRESSLLYFVRDAQRGWMVAE